MPQAALPEPRATVLSGRVHLRKVYRDTLQRPLVGTVTLVGSLSHVEDDLTVLPAPVTVSLANGVLDVDLPPDTYQFTASLRTAEGKPVEDRGSVVLG